MSIQPPPPTPEEITWALRMAAIEDELPFPGVGCRPPRASTGERLARLLEAAERLLTEQVVDPAALVERIASLSSAANEADAWVRRGEAAA